RLQVRVVHENPREAGLQALLARGDRRGGDFLELAAAFEGDWRRALREGPGAAAFYTRRERAADGAMPGGPLGGARKEGGLEQEGGVWKEWQGAGLADPVTA